MVTVNIAVRELGGLKRDYSLDFELPEVPAVGSYISVHRPDKPEPYGEDMIVRKVWWRLKHPEIAGRASTPVKVGTLHEILVECDQASGPWSSDAWLDQIEAARNRGVEVEAFEIARLNVRERDVKGGKGN